MFNQLKKEIVVTAFCGVLAAFPLAWPTAFHVDEVRNPMFETFPKAFGGWMGKDVPVDEKTYEILETRNVLSRIYENPKGEQIHLLLVGSRKDRRVAHPPEVCYLSSNFIIVDERADRLRVGDEDIPVKGFLAKNERRPDQQEQVFYLYKVGDVYTINYYSQQLKFAMDRLTQKSSEVLLIRIAILSPLSLQESKESAQDFLANVLRNYKSSAK